MKKSEFEKGYEKAKADILKIIEETSKTINSEIDKGLELPYDKRVLEALKRLRNQIVAR